jgi:hypothetical protein
MVLIPKITANIKNIYMHRKQDAYHYFQPLLRHGTEQGRRRTKLRSEVKKLNKKGGHIGPPLYSNYYKAFMVLSLS